MVGTNEGSLHCRNCGHIQQVGWDDPESWTEGKFNWDFNLPLEGMSGDDELLQPGERNWVIPTRDFGPRHHGARDYPRIPKGGVYHEAPTSERARIMTHGLHPARPHLNEEQWGPPNTEGRSPHHWLQEQPEGIYTWGAPPTEPSPQHDIWHIPAEQIHDWQADSLTSGLIVKHPVFPTLYHGGPEDTSMGIWKDKGQKWKELNEKGANPSYAPMVYDEDPKVVNPDKEIRIGSTRSLYHGTLLDHLPSIQQHGLLPEVGPFVSDAYDLNEPSNWMAFSPEEVGVEPVAFMTDKKRLEKALNAIRFNVGQKLDKRWSDVTPLDVRNHGLLVKQKGEMGAQDPPMNYVWDEQHEEPFEEGPRAHQPRGVAGEGPYQAEPGDYYSREPVGGLEHIHGPAMMRVFERHGLIPWWDPRVPGQGVMPDAAKEVYGAWTLLEPAEAQRAASLIGEMRDGWGRFASTVPWVFGTPGKGIYFPDTGTVRVWGDDRTHPEVVLEDENASQGDGHHFVIRPDGTVKDQGAMNSNFESVEGDVGGLAQALHELDPRLHIAPASTNSWQFGPTEPIEEEPSAISRGEKGGTTNDVQTSNDYAGGL